ncbi:hypothetical protein CVU37_07890 [candidate division BRC1 bacterium HGW-BRC1-1]|jgi:hypothetical protein|nr:MAG: hypothetical protein CVU37_07890 [candidate division BRC1 bacterium HGW-BRC1-1]
MLANLRIPKHNFLMMKLYELFWQSMDLRRDDDGQLPPDFDLLLTPVHPPDNVRSEAARDIALVTRQAPKQFSAMVVSQPGIAARPFCFIHTVKRGLLPDFTELFENYVDKNAFIAETLLRLRPHYDLPYVLFLGDSGFFLYDVAAEELLKWGSDLTLLEELLIQPVVAGVSVMESWDAIPRKSVTQRSEEFARWLDLWKACIGARMNSTPALVQGLLQKVILLFLYDLHYGLADSDMRLRSNFLEHRTLAGKARKSAKMPQPFDGVAWLFEAVQEVREKCHIEFLYWNETETTFFALLAEEGRRQFSQFVLELFLLSQSKFDAAVQTDVFTDSDSRLKLWKFTVMESLDVCKRLHVDDVNVYDMIIVDTDEGGVGWAMHVVNKLLEFWHMRLWKMQRALAEHRVVAVQFDMFQQPDIERARVPSVEDVFELAYAGSLRLEYGDPSDRATLEYLMILRVLECSRLWELKLSPLDHLSDCFTRKQDAAALEEY